MLTYFSIIYVYFITGLIILEYAAEVWTHVEIEAEDYFFPLEPVSVADLYQSTKRKPGIKTLCSSLY